METTEDQIIVLEDRLLAAMKTSDITELEKLLHDDLVFNTPTGVTISKPTDIENYRDGKMIVYDIAMADRIIKVVGSVASLAVTVNLKAKFSEQNIDGTYRYLRVWKFEYGSWQIIAGSGFKI